MDSKTYNTYSSQITQKKSQGASQAMLYATGLKPNDMQKPQVGIGSVWYEGNPCNMHLNQLSKYVKEGIQKNNLVGMRFNTIGVSDGISMGTRGMSYSLPSRDIIADSVETLVSAQWYDAFVAIPGCDKNMPGCIMGMARLNRPSIMVYGGTIKPGYEKTKGKIDIVSAFQCYGEYIAQKIDEKTRKSIIQKACPGAGACGGMYTANTMASAIEAMGMTLPYSSSNPAESKEKKKECQLIGKAIDHLIKNDITPDKILTKSAFENAIAIVIALGGSTNAVLHLIAMARSAKIELHLKDFQRISDKTPYLADLKPSGKYVMEDIHKIGGIPAVLKYLLSKNLIDGSILTVTGKTLEDNIKDLPPLQNGQKVIFSIENPIKKTGHIKILSGNLAPEGAVAKITGKEGSSFIGFAKVFDSEEAMMEALKEKKIKKQDVIIIRYEGPKGGPGMPEMLTPTSAIVGANLSKDVASFNRWQI